MERHGFYAVAGSGGGGPGPGLPPEIKVIGKWNSPTNNGNGWTGQTISIGAREPGSALLIVVLMSGAGRFMQSVVNEVRLAGQQINNFMGSGGYCDSDGSGPTVGQAAVLTDDGAITGDVPLAIELGYGASVGCSVLAIEINAGYGAADTCGAATSFYSSGSSLSIDPNLGLSGNGREEGDLIVGILTHRNTGSDGSRYGIVGMEPVATERIQTQGWSHIAMITSPPVEEDKDLLGMPSYTVATSNFSHSGMALIHVPRKKAPPARFVRKIGAVMRWDASGGVTSWSKNITLPPRTPGSHLVMVASGTRRGSNSQGTMGLSLGGLAANVVVTEGWTGTSSGITASIFLLDNDTLTGDVTLNMTSTTNYTYGCAIYEVIGYSKTPARTDKSRQADLLIQLLFQVDGNDNAGNLYFMSETVTDGIGLLQGYDYFPFSDQFLTNDKSWQDFVMRWASSNNVDHGFGVAHYGTFMGTGWQPRPPGPPAGTKAFIGGCIASGWLTAAGIGVTCYAEFEPI